MLTTIPTNLDLQLREAIMAGNAVRVKVLADELKFLPPTTLPPVDRHGVPVRNCETRTEVGKALHMELEQRGGVIGTERARGISRRIAVWNRTVRTLKEDYDIDLPTSKASVDYTPDPTMDIMDPVTLQDRKHHVPTAL